MGRLLFFWSVCCGAFSVQAYQSEERTVYGYSAIESESYDEWDKKNSAVHDAMRNLTYSLSSELMSGEEIKSVKKLMERKVIPASNLFILNAEVLNHGLEREGEYESYQAQVKFTYSMVNFKKLLKSKGILFKSLSEPRVVALVEVMDEEKLQVYRWWEEKNPKLHPALIPIHRRLKVALKEQGYILLDPKVYRPLSRVSPRTIAKRAGAHYYISGEVFVSPKKFKKSSHKTSKWAAMNLKNGKFFFHETKSQKLVSKINVIKFKKQYKEIKKRALASLPSSSQEEAQPLEAKAAPPPSDLLTDSFRKAVHTMKVLGDPESLTQGLTTITVRGVKHPRELKRVKDSFRALSESGLDSFVERSLMQGEVVFLARSKQNAAVLKALIEEKAPLKNGVFKEGQGDEALVFDYDSTASSPLRESL